ncbi:MAG: cyclodeaminase/cyclohydrolase family protein [Oscillospiraceae bacterium]|nr:cyclodeaminase/cyclohydrolase family protein [Oscillospiraceae bacterium]
MEQTLRGFVAGLSSSEPSPGGGGASALIGALGAALCLMAANLTSGKKKYEQFQADIEDIISRASESAQKLTELIGEDAKAFAPLAAAYTLPRDKAEREQILEEALKGACRVPMEILRESARIAEIAEELAQKGSKLVISDVGIAAVSSRAAAQGAAMNVYINTKMMKNRDYAGKLNAEAESVLSGAVSRCEKIREQITNELQN